MKSHIIVALVIFTLLPAKTNLIELDLNNSSSDSMRTHTFGAEDPSYMQPLLTVADISEYYSFIWKDWTIERYFPNKSAGWQIFCYDITGPLPEINGGGNGVRSLVWRYYNHTMNEQALIAWVMNKTSIFSNSKPTKLSVVLDSAWSHCNASSTGFSDALVNDGRFNASVWESGIAIEGMLAAAELFNDPLSLCYAIALADLALISSQNDKGYFFYNYALASSDLPNQGRTLAGLLQVYQVTGQLCYLERSIAWGEYICNGNWPFYEGAILCTNCSDDYHHPLEWCIYPDLMYMTGSPLITLGNISNNATFSDVGALQILSTGNLTRDPFSQLHWAHYNTSNQEGYDVLWSRGNTWALASLAEALKWLPDGHPNRTQVKNEFLALLAQLKSCVNDTGQYPSFHTHLNNTSTTLDSSANLLYIIAVGLGITLDIIPEEEEVDYGMLLVELYEHAVRNSTDWNGTMQVSYSFGHYSNESFSAPGSFCFPLHLLFQARVILDDICAKLGIAGPKDEEYPFPWSPRPQDKNEPADDTTTEINHCDEPSNRENDPDIPNRINFLCFGIVGLAIIIGFSILYGSGRNIPTRPRKRLVPGGCGLGLLGSL